MRLPTAGGWLDILLDVPGECGACDRKGGGMAVIDVHVDEPSHPDIPHDLSLTFCGTCLAEALGILLGRRHVQHGGEIADLSVTAPARSARG